MAVEKVTVVVPTFRRPHGIIKVLDALGTQQDVGLPWDIVVVDNDDSPGAEMAFSAASDGFPVPVRLVREPRRGSAHARNRGIAEASGDVVVFLDDDVVPAGDWLYRLVEPIIDDRCDATGGRVLLDPSVELPGWWAEWMAGYLAAFDLDPNEIELLPDGWVLTASVALRADLLRASGGFDPELGPRSGVPLVDDDISLSRRFMIAGGRIRFIPDAVVVHEVPGQRLSRRYLMRRIYAQGRSDWLLDREELLKRPLGGTGRALASLWGHLRDRSAEGIWHRAVLFRSACNVAFTAGFLRETSRGLVTRWGPRRPPGPPVPTPREQR